MEMQENQGFQHLDVRKYIVGQGVLTNFWHRQKRLAQVSTDCLV